MLAESPAVVASRLIWDGTAALRSPPLVRLARAVLALAAWLLLALAAAGARVAGDAQKQGAAPLANKRVAHGSSWCACAARSLTLARARAARPQPRAPRPRRRGGFCLRAAAVQCRTIALLLAACSFRAQLAHGQPAWSTVVSLAPSITGVTCVMGGGSTMTFNGAAVCSDILNASPAWNVLNSVRPRGMPA
jgi:hypothetical protein